MTASEEYAEIAVENQIPFGYYGMYLRFDFGLVAAL
jgi:hypothetical protein